MILDLLGHRRFLWLSSIHAPNPYRVARNLQPKRLGTAERTHRRERLFRLERLFIIVARAISGSINRLQSAPIATQALAAIRDQNAPARLFSAVVVALLVVGGGLAPSVAVADATGAISSPAPIKREILAIYSGHEEPAPDRTRIHRFVEMPLNYLGYVVTYWDINTGLPTPERTANVHGVVSWFQRPQSN